MPPENRGSIFCASLCTTKCYKSNKAGPHPAPSTAMPPESGGSFFCASLCTTKYHKSNKAGPHPPPSTAMPPENGGSFFVLHSAPQGAIRATKLGLIHPQALPCHLKTEGPSFCASLCTTSCYKSNKAGPHPPPSTAMLPRSETGVEVDLWFTETRKQEGSTAVSGIHLQQGTRLNQAATSTPPATSRQGTST
eukprot:1158702-Pelagomonas_calceolata.AAC.18